MYVLLVDFISGLVVVMNLVSDCDRIFEVLCNDKMCLKGNSCEYIVLFFF